MKTRIFALVLTVGLAVAAVAPSLFAQPAVNTWNATSTQILSDTLPRFAAESVFVTPGFPIQGARAIVVVASTNGADTLAAVIPQVKVKDSAYLGTAAGALFGSTESGTSINLTSGGRVVWAFYGSSTAGGTPLPIMADSLRLRVKSADARRYNSASSATLAPTGTITFVVTVWR